MKILFIIILLIVSWGCNFYPQSESIQKSINNKVNQNAIDSVKLDFDSKQAEYAGKISGGFIYLKTSYFLVISNLDERESKKIADETIERAVNGFYNSYFAQKPTDVTVIFLFKDDSSYRKWAKKLFDDDDLSRFGYYKPGSKVMLMNISTGTGTLVHEMTHSLVRYDFPNIRSWFNEGLGSLYERCSLSNNTILGYTNWRLPRLQDAIKSGTYLSLHDLMNINDDDFYGNASDLNYAEARFFCQYLQNTGMLKKFYKAYRDRFDEDKSGVKFLEALFGKELKYIQADFIGWALKLTYPE